MGSLVEELRSDADVVVLAGAPVGVVGDSLALVGFVDEVVLVACPGVTRVDDMQRAVEALKAAGSSPVGVVTTSVPKRRLLRATLDRLHAMSRLRGSTKQAAAEQAPGAAGTTTEVPVA